MYAQFTYFLFVAPNHDNKNNIISPTERERENGGRLHSEVMRLLGHEGINMVQYVHVLLTWISYVYELRDCPCMKEWMEASRQPGIINHGSLYPKDFK